ncbi:uncharacterized protein N7482_001318 [Penicillium canariense]|uniref:Uncharacterized protein n=1 Tax=Penicillium canariense TaxID=189055 RepID=A0A9W9IGX5_9EURO|nr:uncharacterized protein N7482_001318 [Penicillium canariense]KAJ5175441.1 hypothetical protein N7482_001318 [Penicillium canariense]
MRRNSIADILQAPLSPPFQKAHELLESTPIFPPWNLSSGFDPQRSITSILNQDLRTPAIDQIYRHLWLAGLPRAARPLHRQILLGRAIIITENPNEHLVWNATRIFIKPLPEYILSYDFWLTDGGSLIHDQSLYHSACGFLLSYCWLISTKSDLVIAHNTHLLPVSITWEKWAPFVTDLLTVIDPESVDTVSKRYHFGELRLSRLNLIYRFAPGVFSTQNFMRGFMSEPLWTKAFLERNFAWLFSVFGFVTIVAGSMQVGLGTHSLQGSEGFQRASVVFTAASLLGAVASVLLVGSVWGFLTVYHVIRAKKNLQVVRKRRIERQNSRPESV